MLLLLPPSETKRDGGDSDAALDLTTLRFPELTALRATLVDAVVDLAADPDASHAALRLGPRGAGEIDRNRAMLSSPVRPVIDRYTGVLYEALDAESLDPAQRAFAHEHLLVHSALFGPVAALDLVPAYRLSHDSRLPGVALKRVWAQPVAAALDAEPGLILDLRSEGYVSLGPAPRRPDSVYLRVVTESKDGRKRALNHFNKGAKGSLARALLRSKTVLRDVPELIGWAHSEGFDLRIAGAGEVELVTSAPAASNRAEAAAAATPSAVPRR